MARMSIYIPDDLKAQMDEFGSEQNWSEVVRPSIQAAISSAKHRKGQTMETAIERLKASKQQYLEAEQSDGYQTGRDWAKDVAEYGELKEIAALDFTGESCDGALGALYATVEKDSFWDDFNRTVRGNDDVDWTDEYAGAFIEGASDFYDEVEDQL